jgi:endoglucanase
VQSDQSGFTGSGFIHFNDVTGSFVEFGLDASAPTTVTLTFRFANGTSTNRPMNIEVVDNSEPVATVANLAFGPTGSWSTWQTETAIVHLKAGANKIRATTTTSNGGPNLDSMTVEKHAWAIQTRGSGVIGVRAC